MHSVTLYEHSSENGVRKPSVDSDTLPELDVVKDDSAKSSGDSVAKNVAKEDDIVLKEAIVNEDSILKEDSIVAKGDVTSVDNIVLKEAIANDDSILKEDSIIVNEDVATVDGIVVKGEDNISPFTEYVNMEEFRRESSSSLESDDDYEAAEEQLMMLFKLGHMKQLKKFLRMTTWPEDHLIRHSLWLSLCKHLHKADGSLYEEMEKELFSQCDTTENIPLPSFLDKSHLTPYHLSDRGIHLISRIIAVINHTNPDITYSPATFAISSLFLHYMNPSETFNCLYALLRSKELIYITQTKVSLEASKYVLRDLTKKYAKSAYVHLVRHSKNIDSIFDNWIWWIYRDLPFFFLVKLTDCFLVEGVKVLYRAALAILILYTKMSGKLKTTSHEPVSVNLSSNISRFCERMPVDITKFIKIMFGVRGLSRKEIHKLQVKHEMYINSQQILTSREVQRVGSTHSLSGMPMTTTRHFSGPVVLQQSVGSHILNNEMPEMRTRSRSLGVYALHNIHSSIVTPEELLSIWSWLPARHAVCQPELLYTSEEHGTSLRTLYTKIENHPQTILIIKTTDDEVFGAFCSAAWYQRKSKDKNLSYFGTGETFLFSLHPVMQKHEWVGLWKEEIPNTANMFLAGDTTVLTIGGGNGEGIKLDEDLVHCRTENCDTFDNEPFCENNDFTCKVVEAYGFR